MARKENVKILALTRYGRLGVTSRIRLFQYAPYLYDCGVHVEVSALTDDAMLTHFYRTGRRPKLPHCRAMLHRLAVLRRIKQYDLIWIEKELFPFLPAWAERWLATQRIPFVVDYDDATFHSYDAHRFGFVRRFLGGKIKRVMRLASKVLVGNAYLAEYARRAGASRVEYIPTVVDSEKYQPGPYRDDGEFRIGWIGTPFTTKYLAILKDVLPALPRPNDCRLVLVGAAPVSFPGFPVEIQPWTEETEVRQIQQFDVGIMPLIDAPIERGKCGYKLIQCMACGVPVIASPVGVNRYIVEQGVNGFLAADTKAWINALMRLRESSALRKDMGLAGRTRVETEFALQVTAPRLVNILRDVSGASAFSENSTFS